MSENSQSTSASFEGQDHFPSFADRARASTRVVAKNGLASPTHSAHANFFRASIMQITPDKKAKKVRFYRNGDRFFNGMVYAVPQERFRTLESLMAELTDSPICDRTVLPKGVRHIFSMDGSRKISTLDQLEDGENYVCSSTLAFRKVDYPMSGIPSWNVNPQSSTSWDRSLNRMDGSGAGRMEEERDFIKPKLITVIRNGSRPRKAVRILLNRKTAHSFEQVLNEVNEAIKLDTGAVKKMFSSGGKQVQNLQDFFSEDTVFFAYGHEKYSLDDFDLSSNEIQFISAYNRSVRQQQIVTLKSPKAPRRITHGNDDSGSEKSFTRIRQNPSPPQSPRTMNSRYKQSSLQSNDSSDGDEVEPTKLRVKYKIGKVIGEGNFATVKECVEKARKLQFALKIIYKKKCKGREDTIQNEVSILRRIKHRNIVQLIEEFESDSTIYMIMELVTGGDLFDAISASSNYTERDASGMLFNIASAIDYLHSINIVHRDIKPENILVQEMPDGTKTLKLGDFGLATEVHGLLYTVCGTPTYVAPEVLGELGYNVKVDVWAAGVVTYILLCGFPPFARTFEELTSRVKEVLFHNDGLLFFVSETNDREELFDKILEGKFEFVSPFWDHISSSAKELITSLLDTDVEKRLSASELLSHPWVADDSAAGDEDLHVSVANRIVQFAKSDKKYVTTKQPGVALITATALDKGSKFFQGRKNFQCISGSDEVF